MKKLILFLFSITILITLVLAASVTISPEIAYNNDNLICSVSEHPNAYIYKWYEINNYIKTGSVLENEYTAVGSTYVCKVFLPPTPWTNEIYVGEESRFISATTQILNNPPSIPNLNLTLGPYYADSIITANAFGSLDSDGPQNVTYEYRFEVNGLIVSDSNTLNCLGVCTKGDNVTVYARAYDGLNYSDWVFREITINNSIPIITNVSYSPIDVYDNDTLIVSVNATDIDNDLLKYFIAFVDTNKEMLLKQNYSNSNTLNYTFNSSFINDTIAIFAVVTDDINGNIYINSSGFIVYENISYFDYELFFITIKNSSLQNQTKTFNFCSINSVHSPIILKDIINDNKINGKKFKPLDEIEIKVKVENTDDNDEKDVVVEAVLVKNNIEVSDTSVDTTISLEDGDTETVVLKMTLPLDIDNGNYLLYVRAYDEDNQNNCQQASLNITVARISHEVIISSIIIPSFVYNGSLMTLQGEIANIGNEEEEKVKIVYSDDMSNNLYEEKRNLDSKEASMFSFNVNIPGDVSIGNHKILLKVYYDYDDGVYGKSNELEYNLNVIEKPSKTISSQSISVQPQTVTAEKISFSDFLNENWKSLLLGLEIIVITVILIKILLLIKVI